MGLDQYAWRVPGTFKAPAIVAGGKAPSGWDGAREQLAYWRKHPNLQGWMERRYFQMKEELNYTLPEDEGGHFGEFNCVAIRLTPEDIDGLERDVIAGNLPETSGFFFGESRPEDKETDLEFIMKARQAHAEGDQVYYDSWW